MCVIRGLSFTLYFGHEGRDSRKALLFFHDGGLPCGSLLLYEGREKREKWSFEKKIRNEQTNNTHDEDLFSNHALGLFGNRQQ